ncbi:MAG: 5-(carboxyamino)imidazole ribonucleotide synthase [Bacteroidia bacterium]|nr:5-(carboxyamino)imidazole ribonucleotide synthase [Bacteroidia bacterium]
MNNINPLRKTIGIIGGGQLGRMIIEESLRLNNEFSVLDAKDCPCASLAQNHVVGKLTDGNAVRQLAKVSDVLTFEIEHLDIDTLLELEKEGKEIIPSPKVLQIIKDKGLQKQFLTTNKIPTAPFELVETEAEWLKAIQKLGGEKLVAKTRTDGYDGKGVTIFNPNEVLNNTEKIPFNTPSLIEAFIPCQKEISVMVARDKFGNTTTWPIVEMDFDPQANLVTYLYCPATLDPTVEKSAKEIAIQTIENLNGVGVFAVEMFLTNENQILVNEIAPRPHNSGHHTIEACYTSQFEQLVRILIGLPLGSTQLIKPAIMINLLGASDFSGAYKLDGLEDVSTLEGVYVHLYGKKECKPMRKMGHVTILANTPEEAKLKANHVYETLRFIKDV